MRILRTAAIALSMIFLLAACDDSGARVLHSEKSLYRNIFVTQDDGLRCLTFRRSLGQDRQTCTDIDDPNRLVFPYTRMMLGCAGHETRSVAHSHHRLGRRNLAHGSARHFAGGKY